MVNLYALDQILGLAGSSGPSRLTIEIVLNGSSIEADHGATFVMVDGVVETGVVQPAGQ